MDTRRPGSAGRNADERPNSHHDDTSVEVVELRAVGVARRRRGSAPIVAAAVAAVVVIALLAALAKIAPVNPSPSGTDVALVTSQASPSSTAPPTRPPRPTPTPTPPWIWTGSILGTASGYDVRRVWGLGASTSLVALLRPESPSEGRHELIVSTDGREWSFVDLPTPGFQIEIADENDGMLYVVGSPETNGPRQVWSTETGRDWERVEALEDLVSGSVSVHVLAHTAFGWVAVVARFAEDGTQILVLRVSTGLPTWSPTARIGPDYYVLGDAGDAPWALLAAGLDDNDVFGVSALSSSDGSHWSIDRVPGLGDGAHIASQAGSLVVVGSRPASNDELLPMAWVSNDASNWTANELPRPDIADQAWPVRVIATSAGYLALSRSHGIAWVSVDGRDWTVFEVMPDRLDDVTDVAILGDTIVAFTELAESPPHVYVGSLSAMLSPPL